MLRTSVFVAALLLGAPAFAQTTVSDPAGFGGLAESADEQVNVTADNLDVDENESTALFTGNVEITQGTMRLTAPELRTVYGEGGPSDLESFTASGGRVFMEFDDQTVEGNQAFYDFGSRVLTFTGDVVVVNASGTVNAQRLVIDTRAGTSSFSSEGGGGGRVQSTFTPGG
ncbi:LptA/OstA family protein [Pelagibacterium luteolum]|uniref:Lipopolysaccharide export system protein LptA n=1 Tax=Pelagibacterium luteolum TaxID=440168 RepID=A0A1G7SN39_9HYPH|nr:LptA/OstA family protein [Pelagibacterium luteolum]SDG24398.1 lipopolysaccharide export system protein LptA [Pelagibacterium luteolum]